MAVWSGNCTSKEERGRKQFEYRLNFQEREETREAMLKFSKVMCKLLNVCVSECETICAKESK